MVSHLRFWYHNLHSWFDRILVLGFSVLFFSQFEWKVIQSSHNLVNPSLWNLSLRISHIWRFWVLEDLESSAKKNSVKIFSQFLKFSVFRAQFLGSHFGNSQFRSEIEFTIWNSMNSINLHHAGLILMSNALSISSRLPLKITTNNANQKAILNSQQLNN